MDQFLPRPLTRRQHIPPKIKRKIESNFVHVLHQGSCTTNKSIYKYKYDDEMMNIH